MGRSVPAAAWKRSWRNAPPESANLGWATITHPFHPLKGQHCLILEVQRIGTTERLTLRTSDEHVFFIPSEWTDRVPPAPQADSLGPVTRLDPIALLKLTEIIRTILAPPGRDVDKR